MAVTLNASTLADLPDAVGRPGYDRAALRPGIVHVGVGNFHRAHMAWYLDQLFEMGEGQDWALIGAGVPDHHRGRILRRCQDRWLRRGPSRYRP